MSFPEELLHFIWRFRLYNQLDLKTSDGEALRVVEIGQYNVNAGPDFEFACIRIGDVLWYGHVEIHINAKDWGKHGHSSDPAYDNTVLHVVWNNDFSVLRSDGTKVPSICLQPYVEEGRLLKYQSLMQNLNWIPCENQISQINDIVIYPWLKRLTVERLADKYDYFLKMILETKQDWESVLAIALGRAFGMRVNAKAFEKLMSDVDLLLFQKYQNDDIKTSSLLFGTAGLLKRDVNDDYPKALLSEFEYLKRIHKLQPMRTEEWKFLRMRPYNFPTYRIAQLSALLCHKAYWFEFILREDRPTISTAIQSFELERYWRDHYRFDKRTKIHSISWSKDFISHLFINCFVPIVFAYGKFYNIEKYMEKAIQWLEEIETENNSIITRFKKMSLKSDTAADSQALLHLKNNYCDTKKCLECAIGVSLLKY
ncbi:DUF2851 family protein [Sphingobacterium pedocola]|uniref:DUF2851 domain-containing protein n=1 Tax=Sphingobacterium pedocola TaxID=2082722 RepID=A0ABR9T5X2_9SPHI|nr:DUF2851 family protein [Sphingobacterium pedocola]MBE8720728.1 DUF2851 domain-containing protein [Sphingobacterium pedocola]